MFADKFDGRHKARLVADGHLTPEPIENIYSGVVSLRNLRLVIFLGKLNNLYLLGADIGNAYLEAFTDEKLYNLRCYEYIAVYVDDLCIAAEFSSAIIQIFDKIPVKGQRRW